MWAEILKIYLFSIRFRIICKSSFIARLHRECYEASECLLFHCIFKGCASKFFVLHFKDVHRSSSFSNITVANQARQINCFVLQYFCFPLSPSCFKMLCFIMLLLSIMTIMLQNDWIPITFTSLSYQTLYFT